MGRLIILIALVAVIVVLAMAAARYMRRSDETHDRGLDGSEKRIRELGSTVSRQETVLREIQEIATSSGVATGDPLWEVVAQKVEEVLDDRKDTR
jgi:membrane protein implicated in regulation of membrane protease activity